MSFSDKQWQGFALANKKYLETLKRKPSKTILVLMHCSGVDRNTCSNRERYWNCENCKELLEYGFDGFFYCFCGGAPTHAYSYKCNDPHHGSQFLSSVSNELPPSIQTLKPLEEINILLLGETGVGKSTFLNGFVNYMTYETLEEAKNGPLRSLVASQFTSSDLNEQGEYVERIIKIGNDENEIHSKGESTTQNPQSYVYQMDERRIRFIDTPGIGDTRGSIFDDKNFQNILSFLSTHDKLHGILVLLKPNESRLTVTFRYCVQELLTHLHRDASRNIIFVFTNSRNTDYRPGDTLPILRELLSKIKEVKIPLMEKNMYFLDNESFRFLVLIKNGIKFSEEQEKNYAGSWDISVKETKRLLDHIFSSDPHVIKDTLSLNQARKMIVSLTKPLADICQNIEANITNMKDKEKELANLDIHTTELRKKLKVMYEELKPKKIDYPRTVCTNSKCVTVGDINGKKQPYYTQVCHSRCYLNGVEPDLYPNPDLKGCACMLNRSNCKECGCDWSKHMHIYYEYEKVEVEVENKLIKGQLDEKINIREAIQISLKNVQETKKQFENEKATITSVSAKFAAFLKSNAIAPYNDAMEAYLNKLIEMEQLKVSNGGEDKTMKGLKQMLAAYKQQVKIINDAIENRSHEKILPSDISDLVIQLFSLPKSGTCLKNIVTLAEEEQRQERRFQEKVIPPSPSMWKRTKDWWKGKDTTPQSKYAY